MKNLLILATAALAVSASAAPFAVGHVPSTAADKCVIAFPSGAAAVESDVVVDAARGLPANGNRVCIVDVASAAVGSNSLTMQLKSNLWGVLGVAVPFSFTRPDPASLVLDGIQLRP